MALARRRPPTVCRHACARANVRMGFPAPARAGARGARDRGALGRAGGGANAQRLGGTRDCAPAYALPAAGECGSFSVAPGGRRLVLRVERPCAVLGFGRWRAPLGEGGVELSAALGRRRAAIGLHRFLRPRSRLHGGRCAVRGLLRNPAGFMAAGSRRIWRGRLRASRAAGVGSAGGCLHAVQW